MSFIKSSDKDILSYINNIYHLYDKIFIGNTCMFIKENWFINIRGSQLEYQSLFQYDMHFSNLTLIPTSRGVSVYKPWVTFVVIYENLKYCYWYFTFSWIQNHNQNNTLFLNKDTFNMIHILQITYFYHHGIPNPWFETP